MIARSSHTRDVRARAMLALALLVLAIVAMTIGLVARAMREPYQAADLHAFVSDPFRTRVCLSTVAVLLAMGQLLSASRIRQVLRLPPEGRLSGLVRRRSGRAAVLVTLPVAYHCIFLLGFGIYEGRTYAYSLLGSLVYGTVLGKVFLVRSSGFRGWALPVAWGALFSILLGLWFLSSFWLLWYLRYWQIWR